MSDEHTIMATLVVTRVKADFSDVATFGGGQRSINLGHQVEARMPTVRGAISVEFDDETGTFQVGDVIEMTMVRKAVES